MVERCWRQDRHYIFPSQVEVLWVLGRHREVPFTGLEDHCMNLHPSQPVFGAKISLVKYRGLQAASLELGSGAVV
jgi:hypothetical protein